MKLQTDMRALEIPIAGVHIWRWFVDICGGRASEALAFSDISAWSSVCDETVRPWEVRALLAMDQARRAEIEVLKNQ